MTPTRLPGKVDPVVGPSAGVVGLAQKTGATLEFRQVCGRQAAGCHDQGHRLHGLAGVRLDPPAARRLVEGRLRDTRVEGDVPPEIEPVGDVIGVTQDLRLAGVAFGPLPLLLQRVREAIGILHALDVATRARVSVPVPGAADAGPRLEHARAESGLTQPIEHVEPGEPRAHHHGIKAHPRRVGHRSPLEPKRRFYTAASRRCSSQNWYIPVYSRRDFPGANLRRVARCWRALRRRRRLRGGFAWSRSRHRRHRSCLPLDRTHARPGGSRVERNWLGCRGCR